MSRFKTYLSQLLAIAVSGCGVSSSANPAATADAQSDSRAAVVVELFTSQGCSSCPPADRVLSELNRWGDEQQAQVLCLSFHVDYWNQLGWADPYSSQAYSDRQRAYAAAGGEKGIYTPQMIVNGKHAFVGSKSDEAFRVVKSELENTRPIIIKLAATADVKRNQVKVLYGVDGPLDGVRGPLDGGVLNVAVVEKQSGNRVPRGENAGLDSAHVNVVRVFRTMDLKDAAEGEMTLQLPPQVAAGACQVIAYVQDEKLHVRGASRVSLSDADANRVELSDAEWRKRLTAEQFHVTREHGTERAFTGEHLKQKASGVFTCVCCGAQLFDSSTKFESGTGWPSFWQPRADGRVATEADRSAGMVRTEVKCQRCDAHFGHVFDDGPRPTGLRYCINSVALNFIETDGVESDRGQTESGKR